MSEFIFDDGRKAEKVENNIDPMTKVTEVYVEPKASKKLAKRVTERLCVCEREIETIDEVTGEVVNRTIEKVCEGSYSVQDHGPSRVFAAVEKKVTQKARVRNALLVLAVVAQVALIAYVIFG